MLYQVQQTLVILKDLKMDSYDATQTSGIWIFSACNLIVALTTCAIGFVTENIYKTQKYMSQTDSGWIVDSYLKLCVLADLFCGPILSKILVFFSSYWTPASDFVTNLRTIQYNIHFWQKCFFAFELVWIIRCTFQMLPWFNMPQVWKRVIKVPGWWWWHSKQKI